jgi:hypothetical protein
MDVILILFQQSMPAVRVDKEHPEMACPLPSWKEGLKVLLKRGLIERIKAHKFSHVNPEMVEHMEVGGVRGVA